MKDKLASWHRRLAAVMAGLSLTLARGRGVRRSEMVKWTEVLKKVGKEIEDANRLG